MSFQHGISGLNSTSKALDSIANNIANTATVGYKAGSLRFQDLFNASRNANQVGGGTLVGKVHYNFDQGNIKATANPLDLAIGGNGFFLMTRPDGSVAYSRNGQFDLDRDGFIVNAGGDRLMGYGIDPLNPGVIQQGALPVPLQVPTVGMNPRATTELMISANLDARHATPTVTPFDPTDVESYNAVTSSQVFDSQGNPHTLSMFFVKNDANAWTLHFTLDGTTLNDTRALNFATDGSLVTDPDPFAAPLTIPAAPGSALAGVNDLVLDLGGTRMSQWGSPFAVTGAVQDGYASGELTGLSVDAEGRILGIYSNGISNRALGQIQLATFRNPNGLTPIGGNLWTETFASGERVIGTPNTGLNGGIMSGMVEESNVNLTNELVDMITFQRNYQANAQSIRAQDQVLQTLVSLR